MFFHTKSSLKGTLKIGLTALLNTKSAWREIRRTTHEYKREIEKLVSFACYQMTASLHEKEISKLLS